MIEADARRATRDTPPLRAIADSRLSSRRADQALLVSLHLARRDCRVHGDRDVGVPSRVLVDGRSPSLSASSERETALTPRRLTAALKAGAVGVLGVAATTATAGIIVGVVTLTGLGLKIAGIIVALAGGRLVLTVVYSAIAVWMLGLAVPVTASYIIAAVMVAPALVQAGVAPVAAHMFIFYYAVLSEVSPPTALSPFAAAAITGGNPFKTMMLTWRYTLPAFVVPFVFTLTPDGLGVLLLAPVVTVVVSSGTAAVGVAALAAAFGGWLLGPLGQVERVLLATGGGLLVYASTYADLFGLALLGWCSSCTTEGIRGNGDL